MIGKYTIKSKASNSLKMENDESQCYECLESALKIKNMIVKESFQWKVFRMKTVLSVPSSTEYMDGCEIVFTNIGCG